MRAAGKTALLFASCVTLVACGGGAFAGASGRGKTDTTAKAPASQGADSGEDSSTDGKDGGKDAAKDGGKPEGRGGSASAEAPDEGAADAGEKRATTPGRPAEATEPCIDSKGAGAPRVFTHPGQLIVPEGARCLKYKLWGGGGGGGFHVGNSSATSMSAGGAGGGGGFVEGVMPVASGRVFEIVIGGGGLYACGNCMAFAFLMPARGATGGQASKLVDAATKEEIAAAAGGGGGNGCLAIPGSACQPRAGGAGGRGGPTADGGDGAVGGDGGPGRLNKVPSGGTSEAANGPTPPRTNDPSYVQGVGVGAPSLQTLQAAGSGLVVIEVW